MINTAGSGQAPDNGNSGVTAIQLENVRKNYQTEAGEFPALRGINLEIKKGDFTALIGRSGSGKSTLINMMTGIDRPTSGRVVMGGTDITQMSEAQLAQWRGKNIGVIFQFFQLLPTLTTLENVILPMDFCNTFTGRRKERALELLALVGMEEQANKLPSALSGGQQQRVAIARALANDPDILIGDEPTGNLDSKTANEVFTLFKKLVAQGKTIVMVTHDVSLAHSVPRCLTVADGEIIEELVNRNGSPVHSEYLVPA